MDILTGKISQNTSSILSDNMMQDKPFHNQEDDYKKQQNSMENTAY